MKEWTKEERYRVLEDPEQIRELHEKIKLSPYRQTFHIQPTTGLLNDPNGFVYHNGEWHLFYQWCPWGAVHGLKHWYHTVSTDLVHWENKGVCIYPDKDYDNKGAYSGSALPTDGKIYMYYTGNHRDEDWTRKSYTCFVKLNDDGTAEKPENALFGPHPDYTEHQRDPKIIFIEETHTYYIMLGAQNKDKQARVLVYSSKHHNRDFKFVGEMNIPGFENFGFMWECPSIERIGGHDVLLFCPQGIKLPGRGNNTNHNGYLLGEMNWDTLTFTPEGHFHVLDFGFDVYAAECAANIQDPSKAILSAWMGLPDVSYPVTDEEDWACCLTLPRELTIRGRRLIQKPMPELKELRGKCIDPTAGILPTACELNISFPAVDQLHPDKPEHLVLFTDANGMGGLTIDYDSAAETITIDRSGMRNRFNTEVCEHVTRPLEGPLSHLQIFIDGSSIELFVNDGDAVFTSRVFPTKEEHYLILTDNCEAQMWELTPAVKDDFVI